MVDHMMTIIISHWLSSLVDRLEERYEHMKKEQQELKQRNIEVYLQIFKYITLKCYVLHQAIRQYAYEMETMKSTLQARLVKYVFE